MVTSTDDPIGEERKTGPAEERDPLSLEEIGINPRESGGAALDPAALFGNDHPIILEVGSGKGRFLVEQAHSHPELNYLGIEISLHYFRHLVDRIWRHRLENVRIVNFDAQRVIGRMLPDGSVREIHIYFPDPWPRRREQKRRFVRPDVARDMQRVLHPDGEGVFVTDHRDYWEAAVPLLDEVFAIESGEITDRPPRTNYEVKYRKEGRRIYEVVFRRK
ncbi:MAG: tRNA (guanosine(46)-N7)-methyltransferase TrmB [Thermoanaerobaculia bacterium]